VLNKRLKILVSAYACNPVQGSEPGMGWGFVEALSCYHDLWVITEKEKNQDEIETELYKRPALKDRISFYYIPKVRHRRLRKIWPPSYYWFYRAWQKQAFLLSEKLQVEVGFDVAHQLNMVSFREPGYLWRLNIPFVWGPIGGLDLFPFRFLLSIGCYGLIYYSGRNIVNWLHMHLLPRPCKASIKAGKNIIAATPDTKRIINSLWNKNCDVIAEVGPPKNIIQDFLVRELNQPLQLVWSGLHIARKALNILLKAMSFVPKDIKWHLHILGHGKQTKSWKKMAEKIGIDKHCTWYGWVSREDALSVLSQGHVFIISSLADLTSTVILEAMSQGIPVICPDHCGFSHVVTNDCGIKIPVHSPRQLSADMATAIQRLWNEERYRQSLGRGALKRASDFSWEKKAKKINQLYQRAIQTHRDKYVNEDLYCP
jgi:glycosyltransferase involved in cell wall biosynthesis